LVQPTISSIYSNFLAVEFFVRALNNPQLELRVWDHEPKTLDEAAKLARRLEDYDQLVTRESTANKSTTAQNASVNSGTANKAETDGTAKSRRNRKKQNQAKIADQQAAVQATQTQTSLQTSL
jgi:hypothetical protein